MKKFKLLPLLFAGILSINALSVAGAPPDISTEAQNTEDEFEGPKEVMQDSALLKEIENVLKQNETSLETPIEDNGISPNDYIPILMYHHFVTDDIEPGNGATVNIDEFEEHINTLLDAGYTFISLEQMANKLNKIKRDDKNTSKNLALDGKYICITIDDGYRSNYELAYPILLKYDIPAAISVITCRIHSDYVIAPEIEKLCWDDLNAMQDSGLVTIYSHTHDHTPANVNDITVFKQSVERAEKELDKRLNNRSGLRVLTYPNGIYTLPSQQVMRRMGFDIQLTTNSKVVNKDTLVNEIPRVTVNSGEKGEQVIKKIEAAAQRTF